jgi:hypothetical protein
MSEVNIMVVQITMKKDDEYIIIPNVTNLTYWGNYIEIRDSVHHANGEHCEVFTLSDIQRINIHPIYTEEEIEAKAQSHAGAEELSQTL